MGVALSEDGGTVGVFSPKKVKVLKVMGISILMLLTSTSCIKTTIPSSSSFTLYNHVTAFHN